MPYQSVFKAHTCSHAPQHGMAASNQAAACIVLHRRKPMYMAALLFVQQPCQNYHQCTCLCVSKHSMPCSCHM
jgi:hypothetical protein